MDETEAVALSTATAYRDLQDKIGRTVALLHERAAEAHAEFVEIRDREHRKSDVLASARATWVRAEFDYQLIKGMLG
jgi:hypothetical protein